jgi:hypothetical protein
MPDAAARGGGRWTLVTAAANMAILVGCLSCAPATRASIALPFPLEELELAMDSDGPYDTSATSTSPDHPAGVAYDLWTCAQRWRDREVVKAGGATFACMSLRMIAAPAVSDSFGFAPIGPVTVVLGRQPPLGRSLGAAIRGHDRSLVILDESRQDAHLLLALLHTLEMQREVPTPDGIGILSLTSSAPPSSPALRRAEAILETVRRSPRREVAGIGQARYLELDRFEFDGMDPRFGTSFSRPR